MAAASERGADYQRYSTQFCKRLLDFLSAVFSTQVRWIQDLLPVRSLADSRTRQNRSWIASADRDLSLS